MNLFLIKIMNTSEELLSKMRDKMEQLLDRFETINERIDINNNNNLEDLVEISQSLNYIENKLDTIEGTIDNLENLSYEEKNRIIDQKILKLFTPYILYFKLHLFNN